MTPTQLEIAERDARIATLEAENKMLQASKSLLRSSGKIPDGCYCKPGKCSAPKPEWCRDPQKRAAGYLKEEGI